MISEVWQADGSATKETALKHLKYIQFMGYPLNSYRRRYAEKEVESVIKKEVLNDTRYKPTKKVLDALEWYKDHVTTKEFRVFNMLESLVDALNTGLKDIDFVKTSANEIKKYMEIANGIGDTINSLHKARKNYEASLVSNTAMNTNGKIGRRELPKSER